jgi:hypothetical protein
MKTTRIVLTGLALIAVVSAQDVTSNFDPSTDFTKYKTYKWGRDSRGSAGGRQLTGAVDAELAIKGLSRQTATPRICMWATR